MKSAISVISVVLCCLGAEAGAGDQSVAADDSTRIAKHIVDTYPSLSSAPSADLLEYVRHLHASGTDIRKVYASLKNVDEQLGHGMCRASVLAEAGEESLEPYFLLCSLEYLVDCNPEDRACAETFFLRNYRYVSDKERFITELVYMENSFADTYTWNSLLGELYVENELWERAFHAYGRSIDRNLELIEQETGSRFLLETSAKGILMACEKLQNQRCISAYSWIID